MTASVTLLTKLRYAVQPQYTRVESYLNPNASCPVCHARVYFYRSPYDGRVFFDDIGPPWPKHACTSRNQPRVIRAGSATSDSTRSRNPPWLAAGWSPFLCKEIRSLPSDAKWCRLVGSFHGQRHDFFALSDEVPKNALFQVRELSPTSFEFSYFLLSETLNVVEKRLAQRTACRRLSKQHGEPRPSLIRIPGPQLATRSSARKRRRSRRTNCDYA